MPRPPDWTIEEFDIVVDHAELDDEALAVLLPCRSVEAVRVVRLGIHAHHQGQNASMLSQVMLARLERGSVTCPICGMKLERSPRQRF